MYIKQITLKNIKSFKDVTFDFTRPDGSFAGWTVFVGGNGSGKTTVLRAIALALMGPEEGRSMVGQNRGWIADGEGEGIARAIISTDPNIDWTSDQFGNNTPNLELGVRWLREIRNNDSVPRREYIRLSALKSDTELEEKGPWQPHPQGWFAVGYGPMRRLTGNAEEAAVTAASDSRIGRYTTLFLESAALVDGEAWLRRLHARSLDPDDEEANEIAVVLERAKSLLNDGLLPEGIRINRITVDRVYATDGRGVELPLDDVSDGCRSIVATVLDVILKLHAAYGYPNEPFMQSNDAVIELPGIVLIDEAEAHLHPAWQRDLPEWFKKHFPNIQFIVSTHSPLIAQAADDNGLFILPGQGDVNSEPRQASVEELERIRLRTAYDALFESAFGLSSTRPASTERLMERWQWLDTKRRAGKLGEDEVSEYRELRGKMQIAFPAKSELADV